MESVPVDRMIIGSGKLTLDQGLNFITLIALGSHVIYNPKEGLFAAENLITPITPISSYTENKMLVEFSSASIRSFM